MIRTALYRQRENRLPAILDEKAPVSFKGTITAGGGSAGRAARPEKAGRSSSASA